jgi:hypothetical protein
MPRPLLILCSTPSQHPQATLPRRLLTGFCVCSKWTSPLSPKTRTSLFYRNLLNPLWNPLGSGPATGPLVSQAAHTLTYCAGSAATRSGAAPQRESRIYGGIQGDRGLVAAIVAARCGATDSTVSTAAPAAARRGTVASRSGE